MTNRPVRLALVGAGNRGQTYTRWAHSNPDRVTLVAVADPHSRQRERAAAGAKDPDAVRRFEDWRALIGSDVEYDAVLIATQDREHAEPAIAFAGQGKHILLEKPMAPTEDECRRIVAAVEDAGVLFGVCHVLRYTPYTDLVKEVIDSGMLGDVVDVQHLEPVGWWHMAHSYVRGPWRKEAESTPMLLGKSCHDLDWIAYVTGRRIERVASFGGRRHFRADNKPTDAASRCLDCAIEPDCPYSALKLYLPVLREQGNVWPVSVVTDAEGEAGMLDALRTGPFGRCVYDCDNDVVDHQSVVMELNGGANATFTMTAFSEQTHRQTRIFGTHGCLEGDGEKITVVDFRNGATLVMDAPVVGGSNAASDHGGGDQGVMDAFTAAVATGDATLIRSGPGESLDSHLAVFAAEQSRHNAAVVSIHTKEGQS
ncbi:putative dehydrogenase [Kribbella aluminosa]|uniref:Dehydrogenase n=1 Tax=Kribbella aluminosa TaxID=416017 RepID=A0ABS4UFW2_9ACTN|nr:Gfo/Idh/MocA family oxidoreductase [Kribbella aluminosa]MBP2350524.1 putative dehydrogenase [Kribbella aluminosa]